MPSSQLRAGGCGDSDSDVETGSGCSLRTTCKAAGQVRLSTMDRAAAISSLC